MSDEQYLRLLSDMKRQNRDAPVGRHIPPLSGHLQYRSQNQAICNCLLYNENKFKTLNSNKYEQEYF